MNCSVWGARSTPSFTRRKAHRQPLALPNTACLKLAQISAFELRSKEIQVGQTSTTCKVNVLLGIGQNQETQQGKRVQTSIQSGNVSANSTTNCKTRNKAKSLVNNLHHAGLTPESLSARRLKQATSGLAPIQFRCETPLPPHRYDGHIRSFVCNLLLLEYWFFRAPGCKIDAKFPWHPPGLKCAQAEALQSACRNGKGAQHCLASMDSDLEALSRNPANSFAPPFRPLLPNGPPSPGGAGAAPAP